MAKFTDLNLLSVGHTINITGAIYSGEGKHYLCFFPGESGQLVDAQGNEVVWIKSGGDMVETHVLEMTRDDWTQFLRQTDILETEILQKATDTKLTKAIVRKSARQIAQHISWAVYRRDGYKCRYCGADEVPLTVDHLVTWEEMGPSTEENLVASCKKCNKVRGNTPYAEWLQHSFYLDKSQGLDEATRQLNIRVAETLDAIPRMVHKPTRRH